MNPSWPHVIPRHHKQLSPASVVGLSASFLLIGASNTSIVEFPYVHAVNGLNIGTYDDNFDSENEEAPSEGTKELLTCQKSFLVKFPPHPPVEPMAMNVVEFSLTAIKVLDGDRAES